MRNVLFEAGRHAVRRMRREPGHSAVALITLGTATAAAVTVFAIFDSMLLRPLPFTEPERLALIWQQTDAEPGGRHRIAAPDADRLARDTGRLEAIAFITDARDGIIEAGTRPEHIRLGLASGNLFDVLGVSTVVGRPFRAGEGILPTDPAAVRLPGVLVLTYETWRARFGADPGVIGRVVRIDGDDHVITGVAPPDFAVPLPPDAGIDTGVDAWTALRVPLASMRRQDRLRDQDTDNTGAVVARLGDSVTPDQARQELAAVAARLRDEDADYASAGLRFALAPMHQDVTAHARPALVAVLVAVALALLIASLNVAGLFVARASARRREMAVRSALGAPASRLATHVVAESAIMAMGAAAAGLLLAGWMIDLVRAVTPAGVPGVAGARLGASSFAFTGAVALFTLLLAGGVSLAAIPLGGDTAALRGRSPDSAARGRLRRALAVCQIAVSLALLVGTGLMLRTFASLGQVDPGFEPDRLLTFEIAMPGASVGGPADRSRLMRTLADRIASVPGIRYVGITGGLPLSGQRFTQPFGLPGEDPQAWNRRQANFRVVSSDYFDAIGTPIIDGRTFTRDEDLIEDARIAIVSRQLARILDPSGDVVGSAISFPLDGQPVNATIVGIAEDVHFDDLEAEGLPTIYVPYRQEASRRVGFAVRTTTDPGALETAVRNAIASVDGTRELPVWAFRPMRELVDAETAPARFTLVVIAAFGGIALLLTTLGVYAFIAWLVAARRAEIGVRLALGASPRDVLRQFAGAGVRLAAIGLAAGLVLSAAVSFALSDMLFGVSRGDPLIHVIVLAVLAGTTGAASLLPALRAARTDPATVLRRD